MGTMPGMSLFPAETKHRAGQAGLSQPEPHMLLCWPGYLCAAHGHLNVSNLPGPQADEASA